ncbi:MAG: hypothetical protein BA867_08705 [Desulfobacterales bacterium S5133MH16]|nr:MAG: hypothetical protein BA867_08705 [Desulfobacterales bacterium S5133MH16]
MKIYKRVVICMATNKTIEEDVFFYDGEIVRCLGGGSPATTTTTIDSTYNAGMLALSQGQQEWAGQMFNMFKYGVLYDPTESVSGAFVNGEWVDEKDLPSEPTGSVANAEERTRLENLIALRRSYDYRPGSWGALRGQRMIDDYQAQLDALPAAETAGEGRPEIITMNRGEVEGYDPNTQASEMDYMQNIVQANQNMLAQQTALEQSRMGLESAEIETATGLLSERTDLERARMGLETSEIGAATGLLPYQTDLERARMGLETSQIGSATELLPHQTALERSRMGLEETQISDILTGISQKAPVREKYYQEALEGVDPREAMSLAGADVTQSFASAEETARRNAAKRGLSAKKLDFSGMTTARAKAMGFAKTEARTGAEKESYERLRHAML